MRKNNKYVIYGDNNLNYYGSFYLLAFLGAMLVIFFGYGVLSLIPETKESWFSILWILLFIFSLSIYIWYLIKGYKSATKEKDRIRNIKENGLKLSGEIINLQRHRERDINPNGYDGWIYKTFGYVKYFYENGEFKIIKTPPLRFI